MVHIAIVEDEDKEAERLQQMIGKFMAERGVEYRATRFADGTSFLEQYVPGYDLIFLDIVLPHCNGMEIARLLRERDRAVTLVFVTNMVNMAVKGYEVSASDFIVKPVRYASFVVKMDRILDILRAKEMSICIPSDNAMKILPASEIAYIEVRGHYLLYHTRQGVFETRGSLKNAEEQLAGTAFERCNVCYLVNLNFVTDVVEDTVVVAGDRLHISRAKKKSFLTRLANSFGRGK